MKKIISRQYTYSPLFRGGWSVWLLLECGHEEKRKRSQEPMYKCRCRECGSN